MASLIHSVSHGLNAGDAFYFGNIVPDDCGVVEGQVYYVLASGLTADEFEFSETDGGAAVVMLYDITEGVVTPVAPYTPVDTPDALPTPSAPTVASSAASGVVRMKVTL